MLSRSLSTKAATLCCVAAIAALCLAADGDNTATLEGKAAPDIALKQLDGKQFRLSANRGKVVLIDYWATWCKPCKKSLPHLNELANDKELADRGLRVFAINNGEDPALAKAYVTDNKLTFTVPVDPTKTFGRKYKVTSVPVTVIVGRDGKIAKVFIGYDRDGEAELKKEIEKALDAGPSTRPATRKS